MTSAGLHMKCTSLVYGFQLIHYHTFTLAQAYPIRLNKNVLWLHCEDLQADREQSIRLISDFAWTGVGSQELCELVTYQVE